MTRSYWERFDGPVGDAIAELNRAALANTVAALVTHLLVRQRRTGRAPIPDEAALLALHETATQFLLHKPGRYRRCAVHVNDPDRDFTLWGAPHVKIPALMRRFFRDLRALWKTGDALDVAAFALWRIASIHPFVNGNGRTADAFAYACLCLKLGALLPEHENIMRAIRTEETGYWNALTLAHRSRFDGKADLRALKAYLDALLLRQVRAAQGTRLGR